MVGIRLFPFGMAHFQGRTVSFREGTSPLDYGLTFSTVPCGEFLGAGISPCRFRAGPKTWMNVSRRICDEDADGCQQLLWEMLDDVLLTFSDLYPP